jgi:hypothetical protein
LQGTTRRELHVCCTPGQVYRRHFVVVLAPGQLEGLSNVCVLSNGHNCPGGQIFQGPRPGGRRPPPGQVGDNGTSRLKLGRMEDDPEQEKKLAKSGVRETKELESTYITHPPAARLLHEFGAHEIQPSRLELQVLQDVFRFNVDSKLGPPWFL